MKITHYCNSFLVVEAGDTRLACDPWVGLEENNAWATYPIHMDNPGILNAIRPDAIYISHLHYDHFDRKTLVELDDKGTRFIIKSFKDHRLAGRIRELGFENVDEVDGWTEVDVSPELSVTIVPQDVNNVAGLDADIVYDLDTSLLVHDRRAGEVFYNNVDNPLSVDGFRKTRAFAEENFSRGIDICCVPVGAASEFPQCFPTLDRVSEGRRIVDEALANFKERMEAMRPKAYFFAGGSYVVYGKYSSLNQYIAQPSMAELEQYVADNIDMAFLEVEGGQSVHREDGAWVVSDDFKGKRFDCKEDAIAEYVDLDYDYKVRDFTVDEIDALFDSSRDTYFGILERMKVEMRWTIDFTIYEDLRLTDDGFIRDDCPPLKTYHLVPRTEGDNIQHLVCHMDASLFGRLLAGEHIWNQSISGTHIIYEREPNAFLPDVPSSLNFLKCG